MVPNLVHLTGRVRAEPLPIAMMGFPVRLIDATRNQRAAQTFRTMPIAAMAELAGTGSILALNQFTRGAFAEAARSTTARGQRRG